MSVSGLGLFCLFGGLSTSVGVDFIAGKVGFSHGGLDFLHFVADPEQPLDSNLRASVVRIASAKTAGEFDVHRPFVLSWTWGRENAQVFCKMLSIASGGKKMASEEDVSPLLENLRFAPGGGLLSDGWMGKRAPRVGLGGKGLQG